jgi:biotin carboxyl carrier protein
MPYRFSYLNDLYEADIRREDDQRVAVIGGKEYSIGEFVIRENSASFRIGGKRHNIYFARCGDKIHIALDGEYYMIVLGSGTRYGSEGPGPKGSNLITSSMPGLLVKLPVKVGDKIKSGDTLVIIEAMKMQNELRSPIDGEVKKINFKEGEQVDAFQAIIQIEPAGE